MEDKEFTENKQSNNKVVVALLVVLIVMVACVGGYFVIKDITKSNDNGDKNSTSQQTNGGQSQGGSSDSGNSGSTSGGGSSTPTPEPAQNEIVAGITYAEKRSNNFYIEAQVDGQVNGKCDISVVPTDGSQGHHETEELEISNKISVCSESFSLKGMNPGEHKVTVVINATDGRTKTLEQIVSL